MPHPRALTALAVLLATVPAAAQQGYKLPAQPIVDCVDSAPPPRASVSPDHAWVLLSTSEAMPSIAVMARPILRLAGSRIDPATRSRQRGARTTQLELLKIADGSRRPVALPEGADVGDTRWTADGSRFAFSNTTDAGIELWVCEVATAAAKRIDGVQLNGTLGRSLQWLPDQQRLLCLLVPADAAPPVPSRVPSGPAVQQSSGEAAPVRTYQDLLKGPHDEALFEHYMQSQLGVVDPASGDVTPIGEPALWSSVDPSPDGSLLLTTRLQRPFSYLVTWRSFPQRTAVLDLAGAEVALIVDRPLSDDVPIGGVVEGPRSIAWLPTEAHTLTWVEALDGGDPKRDVERRDRLVVHDPRTQGRASWAELQHRFSGLEVAPGGAWALLSEFDRDTRRARTWRLPHRDVDTPQQLLIDRSTQDAYGDPGRPLSRTDARGNRVLRLSQGALLLAGRGASPQGDRPFLDRWDLGSNQKQRLFHCGEQVYESVVSVLDEDATQLLVVHESPTEPPNHFVVDATSGERRQITDHRDAAAALTAGIKKERLDYERADGIPLSGTLYTPPGYDGSARLPLLVWAYPREYSRAADAGQVRGSVHRYTRLSGTSPLLLTLAGYAVLDGASMPIVGPTETANDSFIPQLVDNARAAIDAVARRGVADPDRTAIAGHSYGAFMTANLLAHSDLFRAGVARSGAYNRTLTPFGFQNERRTYWEAPEIYFSMSPFMHAPKIDEPLLLIHGEMDNNSGTFPIQSKRLFHAVKGHGGTARLVMLPHESHGYRARESVLHCLAETIEWLDRYVKPAKPDGQAVPASHGRDR